METFELMIDDLLTSELMVDAVALVEEPAIEAGWNAFKGEVKPLRFAEVVADERLIIGPAMIPDLKIFRRDEDGREYNVVFSKETIKSIALKFFKKGFQLNTNINHNPAEKKEGVTFFMSFIKDEAKGIKGLEGNYPDGTWFLGAKVEDDDTWSKVKKGEITGFSVEGMFKYKKAKITEDEAMQKIKEILSRITD
jgi:hypothetical protein